MRAPWILSRFSLKEGVAEHAEGRGMAARALHDDVVVLTSLDEGASARSCWQARLSICTLARRWTALQPSSIASSLKACGCRRSAAGRGPRSWRSAGWAMSDQLRLDYRPSGPGRSAPWRRAPGRSGSSVSWRAGPCFRVAKTMPSEADDDLDRRTPFSCRCRTRRR